MLICQVVPGKTSEILVLPLCLCLFGAIAWRMGLTSLERGGKGWGRIPGGLLLAFAVIHGFQMVWKLYDPQLGYFYRLSISRRMYFAHYVALLMPIALITVLAIYSNVQRRRNLDQL